MFKGANIMKIVFSFLVLILLSLPKFSYAEWSVGLNIGGPGYYHDDHGFYRWHDHPHYGWHFHHLPGGYFTIWAGGVKYYYYDGLYYTYVGDGDYVLVNPPVGAVVTTIPSDFQPVIINGVTYYVNNGIYYVYTPHGYQIVANPVTVTPVSATVVAAPVVNDTQNTFPVNVPNSTGGYTTVVIKKSGSGYVGPQGEFYPEFHNVSQLKVMYGK
jgi:hypothetical protein